MEDTSFRIKLVATIDDGNVSKLHIKTLEWSAEDISASATLACFCCSQRYQIGLEFIKLEPDSDKEDITDLEEKDTVLPAVEYYVESMISPHHESTFILTPPPPPTSLQVEIPNEIPAKKPRKPRAKKPPKTFVCLFCKKSWNRKSLLDRHMESHTGKFDCFYCSATLRTKLRLLNHFAAVHQIGEECNICGEIYTKRRLQMHQATTHGQRSRFECFHCGLKTMYKDALVRHMNTAHIRMNKFVCEACGKIYFDKTSLKTHQQAHHGLEKGARPERCKKRPKADEEDGPFQCTSCPVPRLFDNPKKLYAHVYYCHKIHDPAKITCELCGRSFKYRQEKQRHIDSMHLKKVIACNYPDCNSTFTIHSALYRHISTIHKKEKQYICEICSKIFYYKRGLDTHRNVHTGEKPYICPESGCDKRFADPGSFSKHKKLHRMEAAKKA